MLDRISPRSNQKGDIILIKVKLFCIRRIIIETSKK